MPIQVAVVGGGLLLVLAIVLSLTYFRSATGSSADPSDGSGTVDVSIEVVDEVGGQLYPHADRVVARRREGVKLSEQSEASTDSVRIELTGGRGEAGVEWGRWVFEVEQDGEVIGRRQHEILEGIESELLAVSIEPYTVDVDVIGGPELEPLSGVAVEATTDVDGWERRRPTDSGGRTRVELPRSASTVTFTAAYGDLPAVESEHRVEEATQEGVTLEVGTGTGAIRVETTVGDRAWPEVEVRIAPVSESGKAYTDEGTVRTKRDGQRTVEEVPVGTYEASAHPHVESIDTEAATESVAVADGETTEVTLSIGVSYSMDGAQRERLAALRDRIGGLADHPDRDTAILRYYGTVLASVLGLVTDVESAPERTVERGVSPEAAVEALLDATEAGLDAVTDAMADRRVVSLFKACEPMPPAQVAWSTDPALGAFLDRVRAGEDHQRRKLRDRLRAVDELLDQQWAEVTEIAPAGKLHDRIRELGRETDDVDDELVIVARTVVAVCLLDAIEELFEHDALVERLDGRTL